MESSQSSLDLFPHKRNFYNILIMNRAKQRHYHYTTASSISTSRQMIISRNFITKTQTTPSITSTVAAITTDTQDKANAKAKKKQQRRKRKTKIFNFDTTFPPSNSQRQHRLTTREYLYHRIPCDYNHPVTLSQRDVFLTKQRVTALGSEALEFIGTNLSNAKEYVQEALFGDVMKAQKRLENYNNTNTNTYNNKNMEGIRERRGPLFNQRWWRWNIGVRALIPLSVFVFLHFKEKEMIDYYESVSEDEKKRLFHLYGLDNDDEVDQVENGSIDTVNNNVNESTRSTNNDLLDNQKTTTTTTTISSDDTNDSILVNKLMERLNSLEEKLESERKKSRARDNILRGQIMKSQSSSGIQNRVDDQKVARLSAAASDESDINDNNNDDGVLLDQSFVEKFMHEKFESTKNHVVNSGKEYLDNVFEYLKSISHSPFEKQENSTKDNNSINVVEKNNTEEINNNVLVTTTNPTLVTHNVNTNKNNSAVVEETLRRTDQDDEEERRIEKPQRNLHYLKQKLYKLLSKINMYHDKSSSDHPNIIHDTNNDEKKEK